MSIEYEEACKKFNPVGLYNYRMDNGYRDLADFAQKVDMPFGKLWKLERGIINCSSHDIIKLVSSCPDVEDYILH